MLSHWRRQFWSSGLKCCVDLQITEPMKPLGRINSLVFISSNWKTRILSIRKTLFQNYCVTQEQKKIQNKLFKLFNKVLLKSQQVVKIQSSNFFLDYCLLFWLHFSVTFTIIRPTHYKALQLLIPFSIIFIVRYKMSILHLKHLTPYISTHQRHFQTSTLKT